MPSTNNLIQAFVELGPRDSVRFVKLCLALDYLTQARTTADIMRRSPFTSAVWFELFERELTRAATYAEGAVQ